MELLHTEISALVTTSREGKILLSIPPIGLIQAATIIATIGNIANFEKAGELKSSFRWAPRLHQSGVSFDRTELTRAGVHPVKQMLFLMAARATTMDCEWAHIYHRLLLRLAIYDERIQAYRRKV